MQDGLHPVLPPWEQISLDGPLTDAEARYVVAVANAARPLRPAQSPPAPGHGEGGDEAREGDGGRPWRLVRTRDGFDLTSATAGDPAGRRAGPPQKAPEETPAEREARLLHLSCGMALFHARLALRGLGRSVTTTLLPASGPPGRLASIQVGPADPAAPHIEEWALLMNMPEQHGAQVSFRATRLPPLLLAELFAAASAEGVGAHRIRAEEGGNPHPPARPARPPYAGEKQPAAFQWRGRLDRADRLGPAGRRSDLPGTPRWEPEVLLLHTATDSPADRLRAGQALGRMILVATAAGLVARPMADSPETHAMRLLLCQCYGVTGHPQVMLELGRPTASDRSYLA